MDTKIDCRDLVVWQRPIALVSKVCQLLKTVSPADRAVLTRLRERRPLDLWQSA